MKNLKFATSLFVIASCNKAKHFMKQLLFILLLINSQFVQCQITSGRYGAGDLNIAYNQANKLITGFYEEWLGEGGMYSCVFYISGTYSDSISEIQTYHPLYKDSYDIVIGKFKTIDLKNVSVSVPPYKHGGCCDIFFKDSLYSDFKLIEKMDWLEIRYINTEKSYFYSDKKDETKRNTYLVKGDIVYIDKIENNWVHCEYFGKSETQGWIKTETLNNFSSENNVSSLANNKWSYEYLQKKIKENKLNQQNCDFKAIQKQVLSYKDSGIVSIPIAENIVKQCIGSLNESYKDSVFFLFSYMFYNTIYWDFDSKYSDILNKFNTGINDSETENFKKSIDICGLTLLTSEGYYYIDEKYDYLYNLFKGKVSPALNDYLKIRSEEMKQGYSEDASLLISFEELYGRLIIWEDFIAKYPDFILKGETQGYFVSYLSTLLTGMDNSRVFDFETQILLPEIKKLYEKIIEQNASRKSTKIISDYYKLLKTTGYKCPNNLDKFLNDNGLYLMLGIQPRTR